MWEQIIDKNRKKFFAFDWFFMSICQVVSKLYTIFDDNLFLYYVSRFYICHQFADIIKNNKICIKFGAFLLTKFVFKFD